MKSFHCGLARPEDAYLLSRGPCNYSMPSTRDIQLHEEACDHSDHTAATAWTASGDDSLKPFTVELSAGRAVTCNNQYYADWTDFERISLGEDSRADNMRKLFLDTMQMCFQRRPSELAVLDCGCGVGRDLRAFQQLGYYCEGFDPCTELVAKARAWSGREVHVGDAASISLRTCFHGAFCLASLYHVPRSEFLDALRNLRRHLIMGGVILLTMPPGEKNFLHPEGCWVNNMETVELIDFMQHAGFTLHQPCSSVEIFGCCQTVVVARNAASARVLPAPSVESLFDTAKTIRYYTNVAHAFAEGADEEMGAEDARRLLVQAIHRSFPHCQPHTLSVLDAGCGSGRDLAQFKHMCYYCEGFDPCLEFVKAAVAKSCCNVHHCHFENLNLSRQFQGIFCMASLYHVPRARLAASLRSLSRYLTKDGVLLFTIPGGPPYMDCELPDGRWVNFMNPVDVVKHVETVTELALLHIQEDFKIYCGLWTLVMAIKR